MKETGVKRTEDGIFCEKCGYNLSNDGSTKFLMHWDGVKEYGYRFQCTSCGAVIDQTFERTHDDAAWWGEE